MYRDGLFLWISYILGGFLLGSCMFSQVIPHIFLHRDVEALSEDGNPGCTNVFRHCGVFWGILCLSLDLLKGFLPVYLACGIFSPDDLRFALVVAAPVLGHAIAPLNHFHGGKCIATAFGVLLGLLPLTRIVFVLAGLYLLFSLLIRIGSHRTRSIVTFGLFGAIAWVVLQGQELPSLALGCAILAGIAVWRHLRNPASEQAYACSHGR